MTQTTIAARDGGSFGGYLRLPAGGTGPGLVVIQEIFGVNQVMRDLVDGFAAQGYVALCPDLFWRLEPGIELTDKSKEEWDEAFSLMNRFDQAKGVEDIAASIDFLRNHEAVTGKVGAVGYCLGGRMAYLTAARTDADAAVGYYAVGLEGSLDEAKTITRPLMLHIAEEDKFVPPEAQAKIRSALSGHDQVTLHAYPGVDHAFAREGGEHYDAAAAETANRCTADFLAQHLKG